MQYIMLNSLCMLLFILSASASQPYYIGNGDSKKYNKNDLMERIDKIHETGYNDWITVAWAAMLVQQEGIIPKEDAPRVARVLLELLERPTYERKNGWTYIWSIDDYFMQELGDEVGGKLTLQRTTPPACQTTYIRHHLLKRMCQIYEMQLAILELAEKIIRYTENEIETLISGTGAVKKDRMLEATRLKYISATELANQIVRDYNIGYRTAHDLVKKFVLASEENDIPPTEARAEILDSAAQEVLGRPLGMTDTRLRELLDPEYFIKVTDSQGAVASKEVKRMIDNRKEEIEQFRLTQLQRIEKLEQAQKKLVSDLKSLSQ